MALSLSAGTRELVQNVMARVEMIKAITMRRLSSPMRAVVAMEFTESSVLNRLFFIRLALKLRDTQAAERYRQHSIIVAQKFAKNLLGA